MLSLISERSFGNNPEVSSPHVSFLAHYSSNVHFSKEKGKNNFSPGLVLYINTQTHSSQRHCGPFMYLKEKGDRKCVTNKV